jgi:diguanylate cyclase (GGDEF)-like protein
MSFDTARQKKIDKSLDLRYNEIYKISKGYRLFMDLFADEQKILDEAAEHIKNVGNGAEFDFSKFVTLADDYGRLLKQVRMATRFADRTAIDLHETNVELNVKAHVDALTGIFNRRYLEEGLKRCIRSLSRSDGLLSVMMIDVDFFKKYNDTYGHSAGDVCLKDLASTFSECITREDDFVARYGGEEFAVILPHTDERGANITAERMLEAVRNANIPHSQSSIAEYVTVSIGVTTVKVDFTHKYGDYIKAADKALYMSKQNGRDRHTFLRFD